MACGIRSSSAAIRPAATGEVTRPLNALVRNVLSLTSMDYEVFVLSRSREFRPAAGAAQPTTLNRAHSRAVNDECVASGVAQARRVVTKTALLPAFVPARAPGAGRHPQEFPAAMAPVGHSLQGR
ncbi:hypothetical protein MPRM_24980 [Mycobacterium parmense]|uniref:Uncharacterized protein n=1 Tax=Mycobacterium parmense TaxID=185642 RepID=A0A7I7YV89_9MYCO|nr:hypothetical protein MPRM_24980 [Mycobacterium parmense]